jgi:G3E family GTPase
MGRRVIGASYLLRFSSQMTLVEPERIPVALLTGFLGSGKTTVLNHLVRQPGMADTAVLINEFGEVGIDHLLVAKVEGGEQDLVVLDNGCLCCTIHEDLARTLNDLLGRQARSEIKPLGRVVIETTGLADPAPILHTLMTHPILSRRFRLDSIITTVDAANGLDTLDRQIESEKQAAVADRLLLTKTDLITAEALDALKSRLVTLNPGARHIVVDHGKVDPAAVLGAGLFDPEQKSLDVQRWLNAEAYADPEKPKHHHHGHDHDHDNEDCAVCAAGEGEAHHDHDHDHDVNRHDDRIRAYCMNFDNPLGEEAVTMWLEALAQIRGPDLLRMKAIFNLRECEGPVVVHAVQHIFHPAVELAEWPSDDHRSRVVVIGRDLDGKALAKGLRALDEGLQAEES